MTVIKIVIRFCKNIGKLCNEINKRGGGILFCEGWNFPKSVSMTSRLLERWEYLITAVLLLCLLQNLMHQTLLHKEATQSKHFSPKCMQFRLINQPKCEWYYMLCTETIEIPHRRTHEKWLWVLQSRWLGFVFCQIFGSIATVNALFDQFVFEVLFL